MPQRPPEVATVKRDPRQGKFRQSTWPKKKRQSLKWNRYKRQPPSAKLWHRRQSQEYATKNGGLANLSPVWMPRRKNFRQFSLRFRDCLSSVSFSGPSWARVALAGRVVFTYATLHNSRETWELGCPSDSLILCTLYISSDYYFHIDNNAPCFSPRNFA